MAVTDTIIRRGGKGKQIIEGPVYLNGPYADRRRRVGQAVARITGDVDFYEVGACPCGPGSITAKGTYSFVIEPFIERGFRRLIKAIRWVAILKLRADGRPELLFKKLVPASDRKFVTKAVTIGDGERLFLSVQRAGGISSIQYKLSLDAVVTRAASTAAKKAKAQPKPMVEKTDEDKAWDLVQSGADED